MISSELLLKALGSTMMGMGSVFLVLILISFLIGLFKYLPRLEQALLGKKEESAAVQKPETAVPDAVAQEDPDELAAVIAAALAAFLGDTQVAGDDYVVRRIRRYEK